MNKNALFSAALLLSIVLPGRIFAQTASSTTATTTAPVIVNTTIATTTPTTTVPVISPVRNVHNAADVERQVRAAFADAPIMIEVARCESRFRQFADSGNVFMGGTDRQMVGIFQIYSSVHRSTALSLGMNIDTIDGNIRYARYLYNRSGTTPWIDSMSCWNTNPVIEGSVPVPAIGLTASLNFGMTNPEVVTLQKILNAHGYPVAASGPGSPGNETSKFGELTRAAVRAFQCAQNIVCGGDEYTTSYGTVGPRTRQALTNLAAGVIPGGSGTTVPTPPVVSQPDAAEAARIAAIKAQIAQLQAQIVNLQAQLPR